MSGNNYNSGYGLCVAIGIDLPKAISDAKTFTQYLYTKKHGFFRSTSDYKEVTNLFNDDATYCNVIKALLDLVDKTQAGDLVTIYFATHGNGYLESESDPNSTFVNQLILSDIKLSENELFLLLTLFKPGVRVVFVFDICRSGTWLEKFSLAPCLVHDVSMRMRQKVRRAHNEELAKTISNLYPFFKKNQISATVTVIASVSDIINVVDVFSFVAYLEILHQEKPTEAMNMDEFMSELRNKVYKVIPNIDPEFSYETFPHKGGHRNLWATFYQVYYNHKNYPCVLRDQDIPRFDPYNQEHHEALLSFLPHYKYIGPGHELHRHKKAFGLD